MLLCILLGLTSSLITVSTHDAHNPGSEKKSHHQFYTLTPLKIGAKVHGVNLTSDLSPALVQQIVKDTYKYKMLVFKDQGTISAEHHLTIAHWFGDKVDMTHRQHPKAQHRGVFRVRSDIFPLTLTVLVTTIDALQYFETG